MSLKQLIRLSLLFLSRPFLVLPTLKATKRTFYICNYRYGKTHHFSNKANAFRHALWNILIAQKTLKRTKNAQKSVIWTEKVTYMYEMVTKNEILDQAMDIHNNRLSQRWFFDIFNKNEAELIDFILNKLQNARKVTKTEEIELFKDQLVYISD